MAPIKIYIDLKNLYILHMVLSNGPLCFVYFWSTSQIYQNKEDKGLFTRLSEIVNVCPL